MRHHHNTHGGKRSGAGRPRMAPSQLKSIVTPLRISPELYAKARRVGGGNAAHGLRLALESYAEE